MKLLMFFCNKVDSRDPILCPILALVIGSKVMNNFKNSAFFSKSSSVPGLGPRGPEGPEGPDPDGPDPGGLGAICLFFLCVVTCPLAGGPGGFGMLGQIFNLINWPCC